MRNAFRSLLVLVVLMAVVGWGLHLRPPGITAWPPTPPAPPEPADTPPWIDVPPTQMAGAGPDPQPRPRPTAAAAASARSADVPFFGFCPEDAPAPGPHARPSLGTHLTIGQHEMNDRARALRRDRSASDELQRGLRAFFARDQEAALAALGAAPDRVRDGFDFVATAAHAFGTERLGQGDAPGAELLARRALSFAPDHTAAHVLKALAHRQLGEHAAYRSALQHARALEPDDPAIALALGRALAHTPELTTAIESLDVFLRDHPSDVAIAQLRARLLAQRDIQVGLSRTQRGAVQLLWPPEAMDDGLAHATADAISAALRDAARLTGMQRREELLAVVYRQHAELLAVTCVPTWTQGVFDGTLRLHVGSLRSAQERGRVVRHEVLHAQVRSGDFDAPQWFHEGLAQHFAGELGPGHRRTFRVMADNRSYVPFPSLEGSFLVISQGDDARFAYHQSLAMIELLVDRRGTHAIRNGIDFLRGGGDAKMLWDHMAGPTGLDGDDLLAFVSTRLSTR